MRQKHDKIKEASRETDSGQRLNRYQTATGVEALGIGAVCIALGVVIPFFVHPFGISPRILLPMHFPVFLAGMLLNPLHAALVGILTPALSSGLAGMPTTEQVMRMMPELAAYGAVTSALLRILPTVPLKSERASRLTALVLAMLVAMVAGRVVYIAVYLLMAGINIPIGFFSILIVPAIPGIIAQIIIVPPLAYKLQQIVYRSEIRNN